MFKHFFSFLSIFIFLVSGSAFVNIDWAGNFSPSLEPFALPQDGGFTVSLEVYKTGVTEVEGQGEGIFARFYVDVPHGVYFPMTYVGDHGNNDIYAVYLAPFVLNTGLYQVGVGVSDHSSAQKTTHWSEGNFYWVTKESYGYTNTSYPNHEWMNSFRTLEIVRSKSIPPIFNNKK